MALKRCPECKKKISDTCDTCVHCGYKLKKSDDEYDELYTTSYELPKENPLQGVFKVIGIIVGILLAAAAIALVIYIIATYKQRGALNNELMAMGAILGFTFGAAMAILCHRLL